jgi:hypothetical protein
MSRGLAQSGIEKWTVDTGRMTMTFHDRPATSCWSSRSSRPWKFKIAVAVLLTIKCRIEPSATGARMYLFPLVGSKPAPADLGQTT